MLESFGSAAHRKPVPGSLKRSVVRPSTGLLKLTPGWSGPSGGRWSIRIVWTGPRRKACCNSRGHPGEAEALEWFHRRKRRKRWHSGARLEVKGLIHPQGIDDVYFLKLDLCFSCICPDLASSASPEYAEFAAFIHKLDTTFPKCDPIVL